MKQKDMFRSDWKRVLEKTYLSRDRIIAGVRAKESLLQIKAVSQPLTIRNVAGHVTIADKGISWLQIALEGAHIWITVMYDSNDDFLQAYFDITNGNSFENIDNPVFEDLYLDVVLNKDLQIHVLDRDELNTALAQKAISRKTYDDALFHCRQLTAYLAAHTDEFLVYCQASYLALKYEVNQKSLR